VLLLLLVLPKLWRHNQGLHKEVKRIDLNNGSYSCTEITFKGRWGGWGGGGSGWGWSEGFVVLVVVWVGGGWLWVGGVVGVTSVEYL